MTTEPAPGAMDVEALGALVEKLVRTGDTRRLKLVRDQLKAAVDRRMASDRQSKYMTDPGLWVRERLHQRVWSKQEEILNSVRDHRRTAVRSCHGVGKATRLHWQSRGGSTAIRPVKPLSSRQRPPRRRFVPFCGAMSVGCTSPAASPGA